MILKITSKHLNSFIIIQKILFAVKLSECQTVSSKIDNKTISDPVQGLYSNRSLKIIIISVRLSRQKTQILNKHENSCLRL